MVEIAKAANHVAKHPRRRIFLSDNPIYRAMIVHVKARMKSVPMSGIQRITNNIIALITENWIRNSLELTLSFLFVNQYAINNTYPSLKNSAGCILGRGPKSTHHLASPFVAANQGINAHI